MSRWSKDIHLLSAGGNMAATDFLSSLFVREMERALRVQPVNASSLKGSRPFDGEPGTSIERSNSFSAHAARVVGVVDSCVLGSARLMPSANAENISTRLRAYSALAPNRTSARM